MFKNPQTIWLFLKAPLKFMLFLMAGLFIGNKSIAEGTKQISPNPGSILTALTALPYGNSGSFYNAPSDNRVKFMILNHTTENFYFGFDWRTFSAPVPAQNTINQRDPIVYWRIKNAAGTVVAGPTLWNSLTANAPGNINTVAKALAGPNINGTVLNGYTPIKFDPTANGEYYIEYYRSSDQGRTPLVVPSPSSLDNGIISPLFDFTVADGNTPINGRVYCEKWSFMGVGTTYFRGGHTFPSDASFYTYTPDKTVLKIEFGNGFYPVHYDLAVNNFGVSPTGNWDITRRSINSTIVPNLNGGYKVFFNVPDPAIFEADPVPDNPTFGSPVISGCGTYYVNYNTSQIGDVRILLDLNGIPGYQAGTRDLVLEAFNVPAGSNKMAWNGKDGLGNAVANNTTIDITVSYYKGRFNLPIFDVELNKTGIKVSAITQTTTSNTRLFWDDSNLTNVGNKCVLATTNFNDQENNMTGAGINNSFTGTLSPGHAWSGNGNPTQIIPAAAVGNNETNDLFCDDFGNVRLINTWGWAQILSSNTVTLNFSPCSFVSLSGNVFYDVSCNGLKDGAEKPISGNTANNNANNSTVTGSNVFANLVDAATNTVVGSVQVGIDGTYSFSDVASGRNYNVILTTSATTAGSTLTQATLPAGWSGSGTNNGTVANTANKSSIYNITNLPGTVTNINFGLQQTPLANTKAWNADKDASGKYFVGGQLYRLGLSENENITLTGTDPEDGSLATGSTFVIKTLPNPANAVLYYLDAANTPQPIQPNQVIPNYDPSRMLIKFLSKATPLVFTYASVDKTGAQSPAVTYSVTTPSVLPVTGLEMTLKNTDNGTVIYWQTISEINAMQFMVERSLDGMSYQPIASVAASGNSNSIKKYSFTDADNNYALAYYRILMLDADHKKYISNTIVNRLRGSLEKVVHVFPNPAKGNVKVEFAKTGNYRIQVMDASGKVLQTQHLNVVTGTVFNVGLKSKGLFILRVTGDQTDNVFKVISE
ncbi:T9SS type A sorting domain-containing protein [Polluticaenibacter yanchengensis]|uniref:T9SS type A sorting domain-containing protein n=1 Tax=Polluticaenibacter yanchengensis TaxID=3014562 RepID=A0ABT4UPH6_9BACT|nr:T9SS type A sorting domain-containing protein [Chitinophagaceae bacterium LY-5]